MENWSSHIEAAKQSNAKAQFRLGSYYDNGDGVDVDKFEVVKWYRMVAKQGQEDARDELQRLGF